MSVYLDKMNDLLKANTAAADYLKGSSFEYLLSAITFCFLGYFNGREHTTFVMIQGLTVSFLVRIPLSYFLSRLPDRHVPDQSGCSCFRCSQPDPLHPLLYPAPSSGPEGFPPSGINQPGVDNFLHLGLAAVHQSCPLEGVPGFQLLGGPC